MELRDFEAILLDNDVGIDVDFDVDSDGVGVDDDVDDADDGVGGEFLLKMMMLTAFMTTIL